MKKIFAIGALLCSLAACNNKNSRSRERNEQLKDSVTAAIQALNDTTFNGFAVAIVNDKGTLYQKGFGFADAASQKPYTDTTIQNIGSVSKTLIGIALLKAQELGKLKLDDPINKYLPFRVVDPHFPEAVITIRNLATHTSGIADNDFYLTKNYYLKAGQDLAGKPMLFDSAEVFNSPDSALSLSIFLENMLAKKGKWNKDIFSEHKPGSHYEYSNIGATLAAYITERAAGEPFETFTKKYILEPLKMNASGWHFIDVNFPNHSTLYADRKTALPFYGLSSYPDGNFITSVNDLSKYLSELIKGYEGNGTLLNKESYKEFYRPQLSAENFTDRNERNPYSESFNVGIFIGFGYTGFIGHTGGDPGVATLMFFDPKKKLGRILIVNTSFNGKAGSKAFYGIWNVLEKYQDKFIN